MLLFKPTLSNLTVDVTVTMNSTTSNSLQFLYDADHTPVVTDIIPRVLSVLGKYIFIVIKFGKLDRGPSNR